MNKRALIAASAAALFAMGGASVPASADGPVKCAGVNSCKGTSSCKTLSSSCKGKNSCKAQGWTEVSTAQECTTKGGKVL